MRSRSATTLVLSLLAAAPGIGRADAPGELQRLHDAAAPAVAKRFPNADIWSFRRPGKTFAAELLLSEQPSADDREKGSVVLRRVTWDARRGVRVTGSLALDDELLKYRFSQLVDMDWVKLGPKGPRTYLIVGHHSRHAQGTRIVTLIHLLANGKIAVAKVLGPTRGDGAQEALFVDRSKRLAPGDWDISVDFRDVDGDGTAEIVEVSSRREPDGIMAHETRVYTWRGGMFRFDQRLSTIVNFSR